MSRLEEINEYAKKILSPDPQKRMVATEFERELRRRNPNCIWSSATIAQTLSELAARSDSHVAKIDGKLGYYLRQEKSAGKPTEKETGAIQRLEESFRSFYERYLRYCNYYPCIVFHEKAKKSQRGKNHWQFPDIVFIEWLLRTNDEDFFDEQEIQTRNHLGQPMYRIASVALKVGVTIGNVREVFFQCLSNSRWSNEAYLVIAKPVDDDFLAGELRRLGNAYNVNVACWNFSDEKLKQLPTGDKIQKMSDMEFGKLMTEMSLDEKRIVSGQKTDQVDWDYARQLIELLEVFAEFFRWAGWCVKQRKPLHISEYREHVKKKIIGG